MTRKRSSQFRSLPKREMASMTDTDYITFDKLRSIAGPYLSPDIKDEDIRRALVTSLSMSLGIPMYDAERYVPSIETLCSSAMKRYMLVKALEGNPNAADYPTRCNGSIYFPGNKTFPQFVVEPDLNGSLLKVTDTNEPGFQVNIDVSQLPPEAKSKVLSSSPSCIDGRISRFIDFDLYPMGVNPRIHGQWNSYDDDAASGYLRLDSFQCSDFHLTIKYF